MDLADHHRAALVGIRVIGLQLDAKVLAPKLIVGLAREKSFTKSDEAGDVENGIWGKVVELESIEIKKTPEEWMNGESEAPGEVRNKNDPLTIARMRHPDGVGTADDSCGAGRSDIQY